MSTNTSEFNSWRSVLDYKARILYAQIVRLQREVEENGGSESLLDEMSEPYVELLKSMYAEDYPLAKAIEDSDLLLRLEGPAISRENPRISVITGVFGRVRLQVTKVAKAVAHIAEMKGTPDEMDLGLSAFAKGSLILGFTLPSTEQLSEKQGQSSLFAEDYYRAAKEAIRTIGLVTRHVTEGRSLDELSEIIPDVRVRDTALFAVKELAPTSRSGINSVRVSGKDIVSLDLDRPLTPAIRDEVHKRLQHPVTANQSSIEEAPISLVGAVREMDLDTHRFDLRQIENMEINDVRCSYLDAGDEEAKQWLNKHVRVTGMVERDATGRAKLLEITEPVEML
ncbi:MAG: hypothetical protein QOE96_811 [Blastocatellia bacterium]|jgi:hypothetical protein|nr:hypothetical protein [Blastocatellia bacterium]